MKIRLLRISVLVFLCGLELLAQARQAPAGLSAVRGFNYTRSGSKGKTDRWSPYNRAEIERDLDFALRLNLNQVRVFINFEEWSADKTGSRTSLIEFFRTAHRRGIGVMLVIGKLPARLMNSAEASAIIRTWLTELVAAIGAEPGLVLWDASNEPDFPTSPLEGVRQRIRFARTITAMLHELDAKTPVTIGCAYLPAMEETADAVDVLSFHDYSPTRLEIRANIDRAKRFATKAGKPVLNSELGCVGRANPYDVTLEEHQRAGIGWYIWELMITAQWGNVHGVFYPDGTVRDPSIAAAILGFFRNRGPQVTLEDPEREHWVSKAVADAEAWLAAPDRKWTNGLDAAETMADLLEAAQLVPMREPPTRSVDSLRRGAPDLPALQALMRQYMAVLEPYRRPRK